MSVNVVILLVFVVFCIMAFPTALTFMINSRTRGKHLCVILEKGRPLKPKLLKIIKDDFVQDGKDHWILDKDLMEPVDYPLMWPKILAGFQKGVWCSLVMRGNVSPLDWNNPPVGVLSSKELPAILDPHWLVNLVQGMREEGKAPKGERMLLYLAVGASVICLIMLFYVITKIGGIQQALEAFLR